MATGSTCHTITNHLRPSIMLSSSYRIMLRKMPSSCQAGFQVTSETTSSCCHLVVAKWWALNTKLTHIFTSTFQSIWVIYKESCLRSESHPVAYTTFCSYWRSLLPYIVVGKPMSDLCWTCQQNSSVIFKSINRFVKEKSTVSTQLEHTGHMYTSTHTWCKYWWVKLCEINPLVN